MEAKDKISSLLPIGSIVLLKNGKKKLMICGVLQRDADKPAEGKEYDYLGVLYPEGHIGAKFQYMFNHENIDTVVFRGYEDEERKVFLQRMAEVYARMQVKADGGES